MNVTTIIRLDHLRAVALAQAKNEKRLYMNGVYLETNGTRYRMVATNGHRMHIVNGEADDCAATQPQSIIIPDYVIKQMLAADKNARFARIEFDPETREGRASILPSGLVIPFSGIMDSFPDIRRVIPKNYTADDLGYYYADAKYLADAAMAFRAIGCKYPPAPLTASGKSIDGTSDSLSSSSAILFSALNLTCVVMLIDAYRCGFSTQPDAELFDPLPNLASQTEEKPA